MTHTLRIASDATLRPDALRTPYHALGDAAEMRVPAWAQHRSVYRTSGRTLYLVETDSLGEAHNDLERLDRSGWDVRVDRAPAGKLSRIALTRRDLAQAA